MSINCLFIFSTIAHPLRQIVILVPRNVFRTLFLHFLLWFWFLPFHEQLFGPFWMCFVLTGRHTNGDERSASRRKHLQRSQHIGLSDSKSTCCVCLVCEGTSRKACYYFKEVKNDFMELLHLLKCSLSWHFLLLVVFVKAMRFFL